MKVGTDGVLLGAWIDVSFGPDSILDIGTGTGLIALQLAQRSDASLIDALEIEPGAYEEAVENFENSDWSDRLFCYHASLQEFAGEMDEKYDLIVSNPPFYNSTFKELDSKRAAARHTFSLSFTELLQATASLLSKKGKAAFIIPFAEEENFLSIAAKQHLFPERITRVKGNPAAPVKRSLIELRFQKQQPQSDTLIIEKSRHIYTKEYTGLVKDFYLKM